MTQEGRFWVTVWTICAFGIPVILILIVPGCNENERIISDKFLKCVELSKNVSECTLAVRGSK